MKDRCSPRPAFASPSPVLNVLKGKKKGRTFMVRKKWQAKAKAASLSPERASGDTCGDAGISSLCKEHRWGPWVSAGSLI